MYVCIHAPDANGLARSFSPWVEMIDESTAVFSATKRQLARIPAAIPEGVSMAAAATIDAAILAARNIPGRTILQPGEEARALASLSVDCLPPDPEIFQTLDLWGIRSLGELAKLPEDGLAGRLGSRGLWLQKLARGTLDRPLRPQSIETVYEESAEFDHAIELREPLLFLIARFLFDLTAKLKAQSLAAGVLDLTLNQQERKLSLPFPTRDVKFLLKLTEHSLERQPPDAPVELVRLRIEPTQPRRVQHGLFTLAAPEPEKLELTLGKIRALVGEANVLYPKLENTYRPGHGENDAPRFGFRYFSPPLEARVEPEVVLKGGPKQIWTRVMRGRVLNCSGPWRSSGDWWRPDVWDRDEFDLLLEDGALYRLVHDRNERKWFLEGTYD